MKKTLTVALSLLMNLTLAHASPDPFVGRWTLDLGSSTYPAGTSPKSMTIEMKQAGNGIAYRSATTYRNGVSMRAEYTAAYDGKQAIVNTGRGFLLPVSLTRIDNRTVVARYLRGFQVIATSRRVVSTDGKTMRITTISRDPTGRFVTTVGSYKRQ